MNSFFTNFNQLPNNEIITKMREKAQTDKVPIINDDSLALLLLLIRVKNVKRILEIGTAIGFSSINMALVNSDIEIDTIERNEIMYQEALKNVSSCKLNNRIHIHFNDALDRDNIKLLGSYDLIFIDAAKAQYIKFFNLYEGMLNDKGIIVTDNLMFHGLVNNSETIQSKRLRNLVKKIEEYNDWLSHNDHYHTSFLTIGDGIAVSVKI